MASAIAEAARDATVRVIVLEGEGDQFCRGMDISDFDRGAAAPESEPHPGINAFGIALYMLSEIDKPTVAVVRGPALGGGLGIAAACDVVLATPGATFALPEGLFALAPAVIAPILLGRVTPAQFRRLALTAESIPANAAQTIGIVDDIVADEALTQRVRRIAARLARVHPRTKGIVLEAVRGARASTLAASIQWGVDETSRASQSADAVERITRFLEGGAPWQA